MMSIMEKVRREGVQSVVCLGWSTVVLRWGQMTIWLIASGWWHSHFLDAPGSKGCWPLSHYETLSFAWEVYPLSLLAPASASDVGGSPRECAPAYQRETPSCLA